jgi:UDP-N-acetylglucosamine:LPS N-acetylglucosamine transferase
MKRNGSKNGKLRVCLAASAGGHLTQLLRLCSSWQRYEAIYVTTSRSFAGKLTKAGRVYTVADFNRQRLGNSAKAFFKCIKIIRTERPDVIISTGAAPGLLMCVLGKMTGAKVVWVDSITNTERLSLSGRLVRPFADLLLTQWQELEEKYPRAEFAGQII